VHSSFLKDPYIQFFLKNSRNSKGEYKLFDDIFDDILWQGDIGGEPIFLIHAPKHSPSDIMIIFRGAMITGDWNIGDIRDCNTLVPLKEKLQSIENLQNIIYALDYNIHMLFSAHGDCLFYEADFYKIMEECKIDHNGKKIDLPARFISESEIPVSYFTDEDW